MKKGLFLLLSIMCAWTASYAQKVYAYIPEYQWYSNSNNIQFNKLTDAGYCFINPTSTGNLSFTTDNIFGFNQTIFDAVKSSCKAKGVRLHLVVGGADLSNQRSARLSSVCANSTYRATFVSALVNFAKTNGLAGIEVDWEFPSPTGSDKANHKQFIIDLKNSIAANAPGLELAAAVGGEYATNPNHLQYVDKTVFPYLDYVHIMAYDFPVAHSGAGAQHSSITNAMGSMDAWYTQMGVPYSKMLLCIPFYGKSSDRSGTDYAYNTLSQSNAAVAFTSDNASYAGKTYYYNGKTTLESKITQGSAKGMSGVAIWDAAQDRNDQYSLLSIVKTAVDGACTVPQPNLGLDQSICKAGDTKVLDCGISGVGVNGLTATWYKDGSLISGASAQTYSATQAGTYKVVLSKTGVTCTRLSQMALSVGSNVIAEGAARCDAGTVDLKITTPATGNFTWWDAATGGTQVGTGLTYSPNVTATKTFYVEQAAANQKNYTIGRSVLLDGGTPEAYQWAQPTVLGAWSKYITVNQNLSITSVKAYFANSTENKNYISKSGNVKLVVYNADGKTVVKTGAVKKLVTADLPNLYSNVINIPVNVDLVPGNYFITIEGDSVIYKKSSTAPKVNAQVQSAINGGKAFTALDGSTVVLSMDSSAVQRYVQADKSIGNFINSAPTAGGAFDWYGTVFDLSIQTGSAASSCGRASATATVNLCPTTVAITTPATTPSNLDRNSTLNLVASASQNTGIKSLTFTIINTSVVPNTSVTVNGSLDAQSNWVYSWTPTVLGTYNVSATATPNQGANETSTNVVVNVVSPVGIEDVISANGFAVYPNPSESTFNVKLGEVSDVEFTVYNSLGNVAESVIASTDALSFGANLNTGIYLVKATVNGKSSQFKVVKK